jgi:hypothetical protein
MNWKRGLTRFYMLIWAAWLLFIALRAISIFSSHNLGSGLTAVFLAGLLAPALLLLGLRWAIDGFRPSATN